MKFALSDLQVSSSAFGAGGAIPTQHTGEGQDTSPPLAWDNVPQGTRSFAVICHDPDAPVVSAGGYGFIHWVLYNLPATTTSLAEGEEGYATGPSDFGKPGYGGPMPPNGHGTHHYFFWVLALDCEADLAPGLTLGQLLAALEDNVIGMNRLVGTYQRA